MSQKLKNALLWAIKTDSKSALDNTIKVVIDNGYTINDIKKVIDHQEVVGDRL